MTTFESLTTHKLWLMALILHKNDTISGPPLLGLLCRPPIWLDFDLMCVWGRLKIFLYSNSHFSACVVCCKWETYTSRTLVKNNCDVDRVLSHASKKKIFNKKYYFCSICGLPPSSCFLCTSLLLTHSDKSSKLFGPSDDVTSNVFAWKFINIFLFSCVFFFVFFHYFYPLILMTRF